MPASYNGTIHTLPPDKSLSHRAALIGSLANGTTTVENYSGGLDNQTTLKVLSQLGVSIKQDIYLLDNHPRRSVTLVSKGLRSLKQPLHALDCENSGSTIRMLSGILAAQPFESTLTGDASLRKRPMQRIQTPLEEMGARLMLSETGTPPIKINGAARLKPIEWEMNTPSAQVKSAIILAALHIDGVSTVTEPVETRNHMELMLGLPVEKSENGSCRIRIAGRQEPPPQSFFIPADASAACFLIALAVGSRASELVLKDVGLNPTRIAYFQLLQDAGAVLRVENTRTQGGEVIGDVIASSSDLKPLEISGNMVARCIDELPMLCMLSACATNRVVLRDAKELRTKESDRIAALVLNLQAMGFQCEEFADGFEVEGRDRTLNQKIPIRTFGDHRIAMSFFIAGQLLGREVELDDANCASVSFPDFYDLVRSLRQA